MRILLAEGSGQIEAFTCHIRIAPWLFLLGLAIPPFVEASAPTVISDAQVHRMLVSRIDSQRATSGLELRESQGGLFVG